MPSALPGIWDTLRISLGWAWTWLVVAELVAATSGLGYRITVAQRFFQTDTIIGYLLFLGVLGLVTDQAMKAADRVLFRYAARPDDTRPSWRSPASARPSATGTRQVRGAARHRPRPWPRTSSSRWSARRAAARARCSRSSPGCRTTTTAAARIDGAPSRGAGPRSRRGLPELHAAALADRPAECRIRPQGRRAQPRRSAARSRAEHLELVGLDALRRRLSRASSPAA